MRKLHAHSGWIGKACAVLALTASAVLLQGCDNERVSQTEEGLTTESQVLAKWGQPEAVWDGPNGERILEYNRQPQGTANYQISIGPDGKVTALRQLLTRANFDKIKPGMMMEDVRKKLGKPARSTTYPLKKETVAEWRFREGNAPVASLFTVTYDADLKVISTSIGEDPKDMQSPQNKP